MSRHEKNVSHETEKILCTFVYNSELGYLTRWHCFAYGPLPHVLAVERPTTMALLPVPISNSN